MIKMVLPTGDLLMLGRWVLAVPALERAGWQKMGPSFGRPRSNLHPIFRLRWLGYLANFAIYPDTLSATCMLGLYESTIDLMLPNVPDATSETQG